MGYVSSQAYPLGRNDGSEVSLMLPCGSNTVLDGPIDTVEYDITVRSPLVNGDTQAAQE